MILLRKHISQAIKLALRYTIGEGASSERDNVIEWHNEIRLTTHEHFSGSLYNTHQDCALNVKGVAPQYSEGSELLDGYKVLNKFFDVFNDIKNSPHLK